jgi:hypothetical protein
MADDSGVVWVAAGERLVVGGRVEPDVDSGPSQSPRQRHRVLVDAAATARLDQVDPSGCHRRHGFLRPRRA